NGRVGLSYAADLDSFGAGLVIQSDGRIVVGGSTQRTSGTPFGGLVLVRFQPNGAVDGSFGSSGDGWVFTDFGAYHESAADLIQSANGGLILAGSDGSSSVTGGRNILAGYTADGIPDPS